MSRPAKNIEGQRFGRLVVVLRYKSANNFAMWECICDCGKKVIAQGVRLRCGKIRSCGCLKHDTSAAKATLHGMSATKTYNTWHNMKHRCTDLGSLTSKNYGDIGISVCDRWLESIDNFVEDMGHRPAGMYLDRIDNSKGYCKSNCQWLTRKDNNRKKGNTVYLEYNGKKMSMAEWSDCTGISLGTLWRRINTLGWSVEKTIITPVVKRILRG